MWHRGNPPQQRERLLAIASAHDLLVTGGSDWHGKGKPNELGENLTDADTVREIIRRGVLPLFGAYMKMPAGNFANGHPKNRT